MAISVQFSSWRVRLIKVLRRKNCWEKQSQKRTCRTCLFLHPDNMLSTPTENDRVISVELPQKEDDPLLHDLILGFMICGTRGSSCSVNGKCCKYLPRTPCESTTVGEDGGCQNRRISQISHSMKNGVEVSLLKEFWMVRRTCKLKSSKERKQN